MAVAPAPRFAQGSLAKALLDPVAPAPRRFDVHRNTVMSSLSRALAEGFPSIETLVGHEFFAAMAAVFVRQCPPSHPVLLAYGAGFAGFLEGFGPVAHLPYLADVARLDGLRRRAWHAADVPALDAASLAAEPLETLAGRRIALHPSVGVLGSPHPALTLWAAQNGDEDGLPAPVLWSAETAVLWRNGSGIRAERGDAALLALLADARRSPTLGVLLAAEDDQAATVRAQALAHALRDGLLVDAVALDKALAGVPDATLFDAFLPPFPTAFHDETSP